MRIPDEDPTEALKRSWDQNADAWTAIVRRGQIPSRSAGTDRAIVDAVTRLDPRRVVDVGCGEGWLVRRLVDELGCDVAGVDGSAALIASAKAAHEDGNYSVLSYETLSSQPDKLQGPYDVAICNFALFGRELTPILSTLRDCLSPGGSVLIQTLHPCFSRGSNNYADGWREESFSSFAHGDWEPMPWYFRTLESWHLEIQAAGLRLSACHEPSHAEIREPLSLILNCIPA